jgi:hypothetical protein
VEKLPETARALMVRTLAATEAPWVPICTSWDTADAVHARRRGEVASRVVGGRGNHRESSSYWRSELTQRGLMQGSELTAAGKRLARSWTWEFNPPELKKAARRLLACVKRGECVDEDSEPSAGTDRIKLVPEEFICGEQVALLVKCFLPWLTDRVLESRSTPIGWRFYAFCDGARDLVRTADEVVDLAIDFDTDLCEVYARQFSVTIREMRSDTNRYSELGELPIVGCDLAERHVRPIF